MGYAAKLGSSSSPSLDTLSIRYYCRCTGGDGMKTAILQISNHKYILEKIYKNLNITKVSSTGSPGEINITYNTNYTKDNIPNTIQINYYDYYTYPIFTVDFNYS